MFKSKTVFVVGAGASADFGFPIGAQLTGQIAQLIDISYRQGRDLVRGDEHIAAAFERAAAQLDTPEYELQRSAKKVVAAMPLAVSIDNFLEAHAEDGAIKACAKLGITRAILRAERASALCYEKESEQRINFANQTISQSWLVALVRRLWEGSGGAAKIADLFENVHFVIFNYDRCVEHFLLEAIPVYYAIPKEEVAPVLKGVTFLHPYGAVGNLPWQGSKRPQVAFGEDTYGSRLYAVSREIRVFTEQLESTEYVAQLKGVFDGANNIVFLGFGYLEQNMQLLANTGVSKHANVYGTALGISDDDRAVIAKAIFKSFGVRSENIRLVDGKCQTLFSQFSRSITQ